MVADFDGGSVSPEREAIEKAKANQVPPIVITNAEDALLLANDLEQNQANMDEGMANRILSALDVFNSENPGALSDLVKNNALNQWKANTIESDPWPSSYDESNRRGAMGRTTGHLFAQRSAENLPPESYLGQKYAAEQEGLDTTTGWGTFSEHFNLAIKFDNKDIRRGAIEASVRDGLEQAGITVPENFGPVVRLHPELGEIMYLRPTEDGKARWTMVETANFRPEEFGKAFDPSDAFSAIGSAAGTVLTKNRMYGEFLGDLAGRYLGTFLEYAVSRGEVSWGDVALELGLNTGESIAETGVSRGMGRLGARVQRGPLGESALVRDIPAAEQNIADTAEMMNHLKTLTNTDKTFNVSPAEASGDLSALRWQKAKEQALSMKDQMGLSGVRDDNFEILKEALDVGMGPRQTMTYDPAGAVELPIPPVAEARAAGDHFVPLHARPTDDIHQIGYMFHGDEVSARSVGLEGADGFNLGVRADVDLSMGHVVLQDAFAGKHSQGMTGLLLNKVWGDLQQQYPGYPIYIAAQASKHTQNLIPSMRAKGWGIDESPALKEFLELEARVKAKELTPDVLVGHTIQRGNKGTLHSTDGQPLYEISSAPGEVSLTQPFLEDGYNRAAIEMALDETVELLPSAAQRNAVATDNLWTTIGWNKDTRVSNYSVVNRPDSAINQQVRRIIARKNQALTGAGASDADRILGQALIREELTGDLGVDEPNTILTGLVNERLDLGNLIQARDRLGEIATRTEDPDMVALVQSIDQMIYNGKVVTAKGNAIASSTRGKINASINNQKKAASHFETMSDRYAASRMFQKNTNGEYTNTSLQQWGTSLNNNNYRARVAPIVKDNPMLKLELGKTLRTLYEKEAFLTKPDGTRVWKRAKHESFMQRYGDSLQDLGSEQDFADLASFAQKGDTLPWTQYLNRLHGKAIRAQEVLGGGTVGDAIDGLSFKPDNILKSMREQPFGKLANYTTWLRKNAPADYASLQDNVKIQIQRNLQRKYFGGDELSRANAKGLEVWYKENKDIMEHVLGREYMVQLGAIVRGAGTTTASKGVTARREELLTTPIKWFRTLFGVLTRAQRQLTAAQWTAARQSARQATNMLSNPAAVAELTALQRKNLPMYSQAGIALLTRYGFFSEAGIVGQMDDPEYVKRAQAYLIGTAEDMWDATMESEE
jgi:hypothetical protein